jgi:Protein of unknown function (DUF1073)
MITNDIYDARQQIIEARTLTWHICQAIWRFHPLGNVLIDMPIRKALASGRSISVPGAPSIVQERFVATADRLGIDATVGRLLATAKCYGKAALIVGHAGEESKTPLDPMKVNSDTYFNVADPITMSNYGANTQDPNTQDYFRAPKIITVLGKEYHSSRCKTVMNPFCPEIYLNFNQSAYSYAPMSVFERNFVYLQQMLKTDLAVEMGSSKIGAIIHKKEFANTSHLDTANRSTLGVIAGKIASIFSGGVAVIGKNDSIETMDLSNYAAALEETNNIILERIAMASPDGIPVSMLKGDKLGTGSSEGGNDLKKERAVVDAHRAYLRTIYAFFDKYVQAIAWNDPDFYLMIQSRYPEYKNISHVRAILMWKEAFKSQWADIDQQSTEEKLGEQLRIIEVARQGVLLGKELGFDGGTMAGLYENYIENVNASGLLSSQFAFDPSTVLVTDDSSDNGGSNNDKEDTAKLDKAGGSTTYGIKRGGVGEHDPAPAIIGAGVHSIVGSGRNSDDYKQLGKSAIKPGLGVNNDNNKTKKGSKEDGI